MSDWHKTEKDIDAENFSTDFWSRHSEDLKNGEFWADRIKELRGEPVKRLSLALKNMPLPASFKEAAIATRALIREKRKLKSEYEDELALLYWLAAIDSFSIPYSNVLKEPGYNVIESIPGNKLKTLPFSYKALGYEKLSLLNKTDTKWLTAQWGEPDNHTTLHEFHNSIWCEYEEKLKVKRDINDQEFINVIRLHSVEKKPRPQPIENSSVTSYAKPIVIVLIVILLLILIFVG